MSDSRLIWVYWAVEILNLHIKKKKSSKSSYLNLNREQDYGNTSPGTHTYARNLLQSHCAFEMTYSIMRRDPDFTTNRRDSEPRGRGMGNIERKITERNIWCNLYLNNITRFNSWTDIQTKEYVKFHAGTHWDDYLNESVKSWFTEKNQITWQASSFLRNAGEL